MSFFKVLISYLFMLSFFSTVAFSENLPEDKFNEWVTKTKDERKTSVSRIYWDAVLSLNKSSKRTYYLVRSGDSEHFNKINKLVEKPLVFKADQTYLGFVSPNQASDDTYEYTMASGVVVPLFAKKLEIIESLGMGFYLGGKPGDRKIWIFNYQRPHVELLKNPSFFSYDNKWRIWAWYSPHADPLKVEVPSSSGGIDEEIQLGVVRFVVNGAVYFLNVYKYSKKEVQIRFTDNNLEVYGGGRYLHVLKTELISPNGFWMDFNFAFDPPCAYSQTYSCSLPGTDEHLDLDVTVGRKDPLSEIYN